MKDGQPEQQRRQRQQRRKKRRQLTPRMRPLQLLEKLTLMIRRGALESALHSDLC